MTRQWSTLQQLERGKTKAFRYTYKIFEEFLTNDQTKIISKPSNEI